MRILSIAGILATLATPAVAAAQTPAPVATATPAHYTTAATDIGTLLDDPAAKAVLDKHLAGFSTNPQVDMARGMTLVAIQPFVPDQVTPEKLKAIDADLARLPAKPAAK